MGTGSAIEWCDHTFNPWIGCSKVSAGCAHCYAETLMDTRYGRVKWGPHGTRVRTSAANWKLPLRWNKEAGLAYHEWERRNLFIKDTPPPPRPRVFCASLADVFEDRPELKNWRRDLFALIDATPHLVWLLLTKRPENIVRMWPGDAGADDMGQAEVTLSHSKRDNVWLGTSVEDQNAANARIPHLLRAAHLCKCTFLSCEPLLGPVDLDEAGALGGAEYEHEQACDKPACAGTGDPEHDCNGTWINIPAIDWVIAGGESGPQARPMHWDWVRRLRDQCKAAGVPFFFKQWGAWAPVANKYEHPLNRFAVINGERLAMVRMPKHAAGRLLDGCTHDALPAPRTVPA